MVQNHNQTRKLEKAKLNYYLAGSKVIYGKKSDANWRKFRKAENEYKKAVRKYGVLGELNIELF
jgi:hypothetical protein